MDRVFLKIKNILHKVEKWKIVLGLRNRPVGSLSSWLSPVLSSNCLMGILVPPFGTENCFCHETFLSTFSTISHPHP